jgi:hypothetical protein
MQELKTMLWVASSRGTREPGGAVKIGKDGEPIASYVLFHGDTEVLMKEFEGSPGSPKQRARRSCSPPITGL